jgi:hypothetical protein
MEEFLYVGELRLKELARRAEQFNRRAWMFESAGPNPQSRRRFSLRSRGK